MERAGGKAGAGRQAGQRDAGGSQGTATQGQYGSGKQAPAERIRQHVECGVRFLIVGAWIKAGIGYGISRSVNFATITAACFRKMTIDADGGDAF